MKKVSFLLTASLILVTGISNAQIRLPKFEDLCSYDDMCKKVGKIEHKQLVIRQPKPELMRYYKLIRGAIISIASQYEIDAVTLVATPLAENTMNVHIDDKLQDFLVNTGEAADGTFLGREMSVGPGQIYASAAMKAEPVAAKIENRPVRKKKEVVKMLMTPEGALRYAAAIIRQAQDIYGSRGIDISKRPEILATLYNIGKVEARLKDTVRSNREPYPNYFGYFVGANYRLIQQQLQLPSLLD